MKKQLYYFILLAFSVSMLNVQAANVVPNSDTYYNIIEVSSSNIFGTSTEGYPIISTPSNDLGQAFKFIPVVNATDKYYIVNGYGQYITRDPSSSWNVIVSTTPNDSSSQWTFMDDDTDTEAFRLVNGYNKKYLAPDGTTDGSRLYYDKTSTNSKGLFKIQSSTFPSGLINAYNDYSLGDISNVTSDLNLETTINSTIQVAWTSSRPDVISASGVVNRSQSYNAYVSLTATMSEEISGITYTLKKTFIVKVASINDMEEDIAQWVFDSGDLHVENGVVTVTDEISGFVGTLKNDAKIRTIGSPGETQYNVLDLGNGTGYFDMGTEIGEAIYGMKNYTIAGYYRVDENYNIAGTGNFLYTFSNSDDNPTDANGYIIGILNNQSHRITPASYGAEQAVSIGKAAPKGGWHHFLYTQNETSGSIFIDGVKDTTNVVTSYPGITLPVSGRSGTLYNWLGRSCYPTDGYLKNTLLYDFHVFSVALSDIDVVDYFNPSTTIADLDYAYAQNSNYISTDLSDEAANLSLGDLSQVTSNLTLPAQGTNNETIAITWKSSNPQLITDEGVVTRPDYYDYVDTLTATLFLNGQSVDKKFYATVLKNEGTEFTGNLLVRYDFSQVSDTTVTDVAEKHFKGTLEAGAKVMTIGGGDTQQFDVLSLGDSIGYFDMGKKVGQIMYNINDYTISAYYRIDNEYDKLSSDGNFLWNFSNSPGIKNTAATGYLIASLRNQANTISANNWVGEQTVRLASAALQGSWHNMTYVQKDTIGTIYIDGVVAQEPDTITQTPANTLPHEGNLGTIYNWIGRSCYETDVYLRNTLVYDLRVYDKALTEQEIQNSELNVGNTITALDDAYNETTALPTIEVSKYKIATSRGVINILGLQGTEKVSIFDISGKQLTVKNNAHITVEPGIYIVRINDSAQKVVVR